MAGVLWCLVIASAVALVPGAALAGSLFDASLDVAPLHGVDVRTPLVPAVETPRYRLLDTDLRSTAVSFDLKVAWPMESQESGLQPYLAIGPSLFLTQPGEAAGLTPATSVDASLALGLRGGLGMSWQADPGTTLFGEYRLTRATGDVGLGGKPRSAGELSGFDLLYGLKLKF